MPSEILSTEIARLKRIVADSIDSSDSQTSFYTDISQLEQKDKSGVLNVAVAGEFNSGKSTFINALLRERLLKEAVMPTTAAATYIKRAKPTGFFAFLKRPKDTVSVCFDTGQSFVFNGKNTSPIVSYLESQYGIKDCSNSLKEIIGILTAEQTVSRHVTNIELQLNKDVIPKQFNIIDTPGFNPGATTFDNHMSIARAVVSDVADMSIMLMPSNQAMSNSLLAFLQEESINRYLHRCIFIITKIDCIEKNERNGIINYVKQNLEAIGVSNPKVYTTSAMCMLPVNKIPTSLADEWTFFQQDFLRMEKEIWDTVERYRNLAIYEHCLNILKDISLEISKTLSQNISSQKEALRILQNNTIKRIQELTDDEYKRASVEVNGFFSSMSVSPSYYIQKAENQVSSIIKKGGKLRSFRSEELPKIEQVVKDYTTEYINDINNELEQSLRVFSEQIKHFKQTFHSHYKDMPALEPKMDYDSQKSVSVKAKYNPTSNDAVYRLGGIGHFFGSIFKSEAEIQNNAIGNVNSTVSAHFYELSKKIDAQKGKVKNAQIALLKRYCDQHVRQYGKRVEKLIQEQTRQKELLANKITFLKGKLNELEQLTKRVEAEIKQSIAKI